MAEFTDDARRRIGLAKKVTDKIRIKTGHQDEEWHVFTFKEDKYNPDPHRFRVFQTKESIVPFSKKMVPVKHCYDIYVREDKESVVILNIEILNMRSLEGEIPLDQFMGQETIDTIDVKEFIIRFENNGRMKK